MRYFCKKSGWFKAISLFLAVVFSTYNVGFAVTEDIAKPTLSKKTSDLTVEDIAVAIDSGTIKSRYMGESGKIIVHIQDAHCNYEAQSNINKILDQLKRECGLNFISVEGAEGKVDTAWFKAFPDEEIRREVANYFMKKGEITGAEFFSITTDYNGEIYGAETREYYIKNLKAFTEVYPHKETIEKYLVDTSLIANRLKSIVYTPELKELDAKINAFDAKELELSDFANYLYKTAAKLNVSIESLPNFKKLVNTLDYEKKIDFDIVDSERNEYIDLLGKKLNKEEMTRLVSESVKFKKGHIKASEFYAYLRDLAKENDIAIVQEFPNLFYYYLYTKLYDGINNEELFKEIGRIETLLKDKLFKNDTQRTLDKYSHMVDLYVDLVNIELTNDDYDVFKAYSKEFSFEDVLSFFNSLSSKYNLNYSIGEMPVVISENLPNMVDFYEIAIKRDRALIDNTLNAMKKGNDRIGVLIAGGFHTRGIKSLLEKEGVSYVVVTPKITKDVETPYIKVLTNQRTSLEDIITESAAISAAPNGIYATKEEIAQPKGDLLAAMPKVFETIPMLLSDPDQLRQILTAAGLNADEAMEINQEILDGIVSGNVRGWLENAKLTASAEDWNLAVENPEYLMAIYVTKVKEAAKKVGLKVKAQEALIGSIDAQFVNIFRNLITELQASPGDKHIMVDVTGSGYVDLNRPFSYGETQGVDEVIKGFLTGTNPVEVSVDDVNKALWTKVQGMTYGAVIKVKIPVEYWDPASPSGVTTKTIDFYLMKGLRSAYAAYNENPTHGEEIPLALALHPGRGGEAEQHLMANMYGDMDDFMGFTQGNVSEIAAHEDMHILYPYMSEDQVAERLGTDLEEERAIIAANRRKIALEEQANVEKTIIANTPGLKEVLANIELANNLSQNNNSVGIVGLVTGSEVDRDNYERRMDKMNTALFNTDGSTKIITLQEKVGDKTREGNFLGTLLAYNKIKEIANEENIDIENMVVLLGMVFGRGERTSPYTNINGNRKPGLKVTAANVEINGQKVSFSAIEEAIKYFTPVAKYLENRGFRGILDKWGDETEIPSIDMGQAPKDPEELAGQDIIKVIAKMRMEDIPEGDLPTQKDWVIFDPETGAFLTQVSRNANGADALRADLKARMQELGIETEYVGVSLGPVGVSYRVLDIAEDIFEEDILKDGVYIDFDPYVLMAFAMLGKYNKVEARQRWNETLERDKGLQEIAGENGMIPDFFDKVVEIREIFRKAYERSLEATVLDIGAEVPILSWDDIGQHTAMREKYMGVNDTGPVGIIARKKEGISGVRDDNGNIIVNSTISPQVTVKNSVIINSTITGSGTIIGSVVRDSNFEGYIEMVEAFATLSDRPGYTVLKKNSGLYKSIGKKSSALVLEEGMRHGTMFTSKGPVDMVVHEKEDIKANYNEPIAGNPMSFKEAYDEMLGVGEEELERRQEESVSVRERIDKKTKKFKSLEFGTSGLRDEISNMTDQEVYINTVGFIAFLRERGEITKEKNVIALAGDRRNSTDKIMTASKKAIEDSGCKIAYCGHIPSPALAAYAIQEGIPSVMVTGSHIPDDRNGIKFTKKSGEVLKTDEKDILRNVAGARSAEYAKISLDSAFNDAGEFKVKPTDITEYDVLDEAVEAYVDRYTKGAEGSLSGITVAIYQHSAVGRDIMKKIFQRLGANVVAPERDIDIEYTDEKTGKIVKETVSLRSSRTEISEEEYIAMSNSDDANVRYAAQFIAIVPQDDKTVKYYEERFVPVDTEKISNKTKAIIVALAEIAKEETKTDRIIVASADGDTDRPLVADELGNILPGDKLGLLSAMYLNPTALAVPISANDAVVQALGPEKVTETKIGSPYVIAAMNEAIAKNPRAARVASFETNGGFLLGTDFSLRLPDGRSINMAALPTRDAILPIMIAAMTTKDADMSFSQFVDTQLPNRYTQANVIDNKSYKGAENYTPEMGKGIVALFSPRNADIKQVNFKDGEINAIYADGKVEAVQEPNSIEELEVIRARLEEYYTKSRGFGAITSINYIDGVRIVFANNDVVHLRPSGNAPEFRNYATADTQARADKIIDLRREIMPEIIADYEKRFGTQKAKSIEVFEFQPERTPASTRNLADSIEEFTMWESIDDARSTVRLVLEDYETDIDVIDSIEILGKVGMPQIIGNRDYTIVLTSGRVQVELPDGTRPELVKPGQAITIPADMGTKIKLFQTSREKPRVMVRYAKTSSEKAVYMVNDIISRHMDKFSGMEATTLIMPEEAFHSKTGLGSATWMERQIQELLANDKIKIRTYSAKAGLATAAQHTITEGTTGILIATEGSIERTNMDTDEDVRDFLTGKKGKLRILTIPNIEEDEEVSQEGWFFKMEAAFTGLLLGIIEPDQIKNEADTSSPAADLHRLLQQLAGKDIPREYLYYMLSYSEMQDALGERMPVMFLTNPKEWLKFMISNLLVKMPIRPFDAREQLEQRRRTLWSA